MVVYLQYSLVEGLFLATITAPVCLNAILVSLVGSVAVRQAMMSCAALLKQMIIFQLLLFNRAPR